MDGHRIMAECLCREWVIMEAQLNDPPKMVDRSTLQPLGVK